MRAKMEPDLPQAHQVVAALGGMHVAQRVRRQERHRQLHGRAFADIQRGCTQRSPPLKLQELAMGAEGGRGGGADLQCCCTQGTHLGILSEVASWWGGGEGRGC